MRYRSGSTVSMPSGPGGSASDPRQQRRLARRTQRNRGRLAVRMRYFGRARCRHIGDHALDQSRHLIGGEKLAADSRFGHAGPKGTRFSVQSTSGRSGRLARRADPARSQPVRRSGASEGFHARGACSAFARGSFLGRGHGIRTLRAAARRCGARSAGAPAVAAGHFHPLHSPGGRRGARDPAHRRVDGDDALAGSPGWRLRSTP